MKRDSFFKFTITMVIGMMIGASFMKLDVDSIKNATFKNIFSTSKHFVVNESRDIDHVTIRLGTGKKVLSYSLFGRKEKRLYSKKLTDVLFEASKSHFYRDWYIRVYYEFFSQKRLKKLKSIYEKVEFINMSKLDSVTLPLAKVTIKNPKNLNGMIWRFLVLADAHVDIACSRDLDSPLYEREEDAVKQWLNSHKIMHVMRDNKKHSAKILGGTWCYRNSKNRSLAQEILKKIFLHAAKRNSSSEAYYQNDQELLAKYMWPYVKDDLIGHDSFHCKRYPNSVPFPSKRIPTSLFVGCKRPCGQISEPCPKTCRPKNHKDWIYC